jgi:hypothetical protein
VPKATTASKTLQKDDGKDVVKEMIEMKRDIVRGDGNTLLLGPLVDEHAIRLLVSLNLFNGGGVLFVFRGRRDRRWDWRRDWRMACHRPGREQRQRARNIAKLVGIGNSRRPFWDSSLTQGSALPTAVQVEHVVGERLGWRGQLLLHLR